MASICAKPSGSVSLFWWMDVLDLDGTSQYHGTCLMREVPITSQMRLLFLQRLSFIPDTNALAVVECGRP